MADGKSYQQALSNVEVIIQELIKTAEGLGRLFLNQKDT
jgi:predicted RNase H-like HicB family nuclease